MVLPLHVLATALAISTGWWVSSGLRWPGLGGRPLLERLVLAYLAGTAAIACEIWLLGYVGIPASLGVLLSLQAYPLFRVVQSARESDIRALEGRVPRLAWWEWALVAFLTAKLGWVLAMNLTETFRGTDAYTVVLPFVRKLHEAGSHLGLQTFADRSRFPMLELHWFTCWHSRWNELAINLPYFNWLLALVLFLISHLRSTCSRGVALWGAALLLSYPLLLTHAVAVGYLDLPLAVHLLVAVAYIHRWTLSGQRDDLVLAAAFSVSVGLFKPEGLFPYLVIGAFMLGLAAAFRRGLLSPVRAWLLTTLGVSTAVAAAFNAKRLFPGLAEVPALTFVLGQSHLHEVGPYLVRHFGSRHDNWMIAGTLAALLVLPLGLRACRSPTSLLALHAFLLLLSQLYLFSATPAFVWLSTGTAVNRLHLQIAPVLLFAVLVSLGAELSVAAERATAIRTVVIALAAPLLVLAWMIFGGTSAGPEELRVKVWDSTPGWIENAERVLEVRQSSGDASLMTRVPESPVDRLALDVRVEPIDGASVQLVFRKDSDPANSVTGKDLTSRLRAGWTSFEVGFGEIEGLVDADEVGIRVLFHRAGTVAKIRNERFLRTSRGERLEELEKSMFGRQQLDARCLNFATAPSFRGHGRSWAGWVGLAFAVLVLGLRRWVFRERFPLERRPAWIVDGSGVSSLSGVVPGRRGRAVPM